MGFGGGYCGEWKFLETVTPILLGFGKFVLCTVLSCVILVMSSNLIFLYVSDGMKVFFFAENKI
jgi:hypothetical protein